MNPATVAIANLGCKANQYDGTYLISLFKQHGFELVDFKSSADIYLINTCSVTDHAEADSRNIIRRAHRRNPDATVVVTGCYAQTKPQEVAQVQGVNLVLGNNQKANLLEQLERARQERDKVHVAVEDIFQQRQLEVFGHAEQTDQTRAYVKIQDGCNQFCSFCIIPYARGRNRSVPLEQVLEELHRVSEHGFKEAILTGIHIGTYGLDHQSSLANLLQEIERQRPIHRVRLSSIDPEELNEEIIELFTHAQVLCPHLHIPLQSGDDRILKLMRRRYTRRQFWQLTERLMEQIPNICLGTDVMVGFPYEDEDSFRLTYELLKETPLSYFHVFPFSSKQGTAAAKMLTQVREEFKKERASKLRSLSQEKSQEFRKRFLGQRAEVVIEQRVSSMEKENSTFERWAGFSKNYLPVWAELTQGRKGQLVNCTLQAEQEGRLIGHVH